MRGYCKCDLCGRFYKSNDNEQYDGITMWWFDRNKDIRTPKKITYQALWEIKI